MAIRKLLVTDFSLGQLSERYAGRLDTEIRTKGAELIEGFLLNKDGGLSRRPGSIFVKDGLGISPAADRLYDSQGYPSFIVFRDGDSRWLGFIDETDPAFLATELGAAGTMSMVNGSLDFGVALRTNGTFHDPETDKDWLHCWTDDFAFDIDIAAESLTETGLLDQAVIYQGRMIGVTRSDGIITMSKELDYLDFTNDENETRPLSLIGDWSGVEDPQWIVAKESLYMGTGDGEWEIYSSFPFFSEEIGGLMAKKISDIGSEDAAYFGQSLVIRDLERLIVLGYAGGGDFNYQAGSLTELIDNGLLVSHAVTEMGTHRYVHALDVNGVLYSYMQAPGQQIQGWVTLARDVGWMFAFGKDLYVGLERNGDYSVEVFPLDELTHPGSRTRRQHSMFYVNNAHGDRAGFLTLDASALTGDELPPLTMVDLYDIDLSAEDSTFIGTTMTDADGELADSLAGIKSLVGWSSGETYLFAHQENLFPGGRIKTLPLGGLIGDSARIVKVVLQVTKSAGARVRVNDGTWEEKVTNTLESGPWEFRVEHSFSTEPRVEVQTVDQHPLNVYQVLVEVDTGD